MSAEDRPPGIEDEVGADLGQAVGKRFLDDAPVAHGRNVVAGLPAARIVFAAHVVEAGLEGFEIGVGVAIIIEAQLVEIPQAAIDRKGAAPVIGIALERDAFARIDLGDDIGAAADRFRQRGVFESCDIDRMFGQHRHQAEDQRQFAVVAAGRDRSARCARRARRRARPWNNRRGDWAGRGRAEAARKTSRRRPSPARRRRSAPPDRART